MSETNITINESHSAGSKILKVTGRLDANSCGNLDSHLSKLIENNAQRILVDIGSVDYISSAGLRVFISNAKKLKLSGGKISLCSIQPHVMEVFDMSGFSSIFDIYRSEEDYLSAGIDNFTIHDEPSTDQERNKLAVLRFLMLIQFCKYSDMHQVVFEGMKTIHSPSLASDYGVDRFSSSQEYTDYLKRLEETKDIDIDIKSMVAEAETVAVYNITTQTYLDGRRMTTPWMSFYTLEDGKIIKAIHVYDRLDEQRQLNG